MVECFYSHVIATTYIWPASRSCNWRELHTDLRNKGYNYPVCFNTKSLNKVDSNMYQAHK